MNAQPPASPTAQVPNPQQQNPLAPGPQAEYAQKPNEPKRPRGKGMGVTSLLLSLGALLIGVALAVAFALSAGPYINQTGRTLAEQETMPGDTMVFATVIQYSFAIPSIFGLAAIVLGIIAMVTKRGRGLGVIGMIIALVAPLLCIVTTVLLIIFAV